MLVQKPPSVPARPVSLQILYGKFHVRKKQRIQGSGVVIFVILAKVRRPGQQIAQVIS